MDQQSQKIDNRNLGDEPNQNSEATGHIPHEAQAVGPQTNSTGQFLPGVRVETRAPSMPK